MKLSRLSLVAKNGIDRLRAQGIEPDFDDVACLHDLGKRLERPDGSPVLSVLGNPVQAGNVTLWPWSIGAERWYNQRAAPWFRQLPELEFFALVFSHVNARCPEVLVELITAKQAAAAISAWVQTSNASRKELVAAIDQLLPAPECSAKKRYCPECGERWRDQEDLEEEAAALPPSLDDSTFLDLIGSLVRAFPGTTFDWWTWSSPAALTLRFLNAEIRRNRAQGETDSRSPLMMATHAFESALRAIKAKHEARKKREEEAQGVVSNAE